ncbi:MAG: DUF368 domain-containing protein [Chloroflexaceae bacterium]|nr:DUF368 domain-containing protein [Chloroflexaceae bacterium]
MEEQPSTQTTKNPVQLFLTGFAMGSVDIIPGVSGGTMAFILGVYEQLLNAIKSVDLTLLKLLVSFKFKAALEHVHWTFLLPLMLGVGTAIFTLAHAISWMLENQPVLLFSFFFGLILASIVAIGDAITWSPVAVIMLLVGAAIGFLVVQLVPLDMSHTPLIVFLSSVVAIMAMILPGISGSFILLMLGQYDYILNAVKSFDIGVLIIVGTGALVGLLGFARVLSWLLQHYRQATIAMLVGFMIGSLWKIWPWKVATSTRINSHGETVPLTEQNIWPNIATNEFWVAVAICVVGFLLFCFLDHQQSGRNPLFRLFGMDRSKLKEAPQTRT